MTTEAKKLRASQETALLYAWGRHDGEVSTYGARGSVVQDLVKDGYAKVVPEIQDEGRRGALLNEFRALIEKARAALASYPRPEDGLVGDPEGWIRAHEALEKARGLDRDLRRTKYVLTEAGLEAARTYKGHALVKSEDGRRASCQTCGLAPAWFGEFEKDVSCARIRSAKAKGRRA